MASNHRAVMESIEQLLTARLQDFIEAVETNTNVQQAITEAKLAIEATK
jgi:hypothetical protein